MTQLTRRLVESMPKVELHLHLEGAIPTDAMWTMVERHGGTDEVDSLAELQARFEYRDFPHFIDTWLWKLRFHKTYEDYELIGRSVAESLAEQRIVYAEAFVSPTDAARHGLEVGPLLMAVRRGLDEVEGTDVALVPDLVRDTGPDATVRTLDQVLEVRDDADVVGITIGGSEQDYPPELFIETFEAAGRHGLGLTAHAGEAGGADNVWTAVRDLGVHRIGHGVRAVEDPGLVANLAISRIPLEVCPTSNIRTGVVSNWETHPVRTLIDVGALVTINTDDPAMFDCDLSGEFMRLAEEFGYGFDHVLELGRNAIDASWASEQHKRRLRLDLDEWASDAA